MFFILIFQRIKFENVKFLQHFEGLKFKNVTLFPDNDTLKMIGHAYTHKNLWTDTKKQIGSQI